MFLSFVGLFVYNTFAYAENEEDWMPDPALREAIREKLRIPADNPLTLAYVQLHLTNLIATDKGIVDLTGLEHATDLQVLALRRNKIHDISPLSGLIGLVYLTLGENQITDVSPLSGLVNLEVLELEVNQITDVSPLAGLVNLKKLNISNNPIADILPLMGLENLEDLRIRNLDGDVFSTIPIPKLIQFGYDETCDLEGVPILERVKNRDYPSVFSAWGNIINLSNLSWREKLAYHDLFFSGLPFNSMKWVPSPEGLKTFVHVESAKGEWEERLSLNPNMLTIIAMNYQAADPGEYPDDWPYWVRDESGERIIVDGDSILIDFTHPEIQDLEVKRAIAFAKCGLFDGIMLDWWRNEWSRSGNASYYTYDVHEAAITMLRRIREGVDSVRDDFLIIANTNKTKVPRSAPYLNGTFMETIAGYDHQGLTEIESTLLWAEKNLQEPLINCLQGWGIKNEPLDSPKNQQRMRLFTTMSLAFSDGYVLFSDTYLNFHNHYWYDFWDADLGQPLGGNETKGQLYENQEGLFIREFTNGWAVYNRSGKEQEISLPIQTTGVESGLTSFKHIVPDLDGEMFLKTGVTADVNGDGIVNIQDLVIVANALGKAEPDLNGDGVVNIQDLVIVANAF
ncbi:MAG: leucine-rich repeat domain-containing protein [Candidatus Poribacteria bacterium]|nr:leucine-rich repeat domain-containing protein [Candidatus Poribacteria bacterium]